MNAPQGGAKWNPPPLLNRRKTLTRYAATRIVNLGTSAPARVQLVSCSGVGNPGAGGIVLKLAPNVPTVLLLLRPAWTHSERSRGASGVRLPSPFHWRRGECPGPDLLFAGGPAWKAIARKLSCSQVVIPTEGRREREATPLGDSRWSTTTRAAVSQAVWPTRRRAAPGDMSFMQLRSNLDKGLAREAAASQYKTGTLALERDSAEQILGVRGSSADRVSSPHVRGLRTGSEHAPGSVPF